MFAYTQTWKTLEMVFMDWSSSIRNWLSSLKWKPIKMLDDAQEVTETVQTVRIIHYRPACCKIWITWNNYTLVWKVWKEFDYKAKLHFFERQVGILPLWHHAVHIYWPFFIATFCQAEGRFGGADETISQLSIPDFLLDRQPFTSGNRHYI